MKIYIDADTCPVTRIAETGPKLASVMYCTIRKMEDKSMKKAIAILTVMMVL